MDIWMVDRWIDGWDEWMIHLYLGEEMYEGMTM